MTDAVVIMVGGKDENTISPRRPVHAVEVVGTRPTALHELELICAARRRRKHAADRCPARRRAVPQRAECQAPPAVTSRCGS
jgi:hypothetical protein